jgi:hypothetical protein
MPGKGHRFSAREDRQAGHIAASERKAGMSAKQARSIAYATLNKQRAKRRGRRR